MTLSAEDTKNPRSQLPKGMIRSIVVVSVLAIISTLIVASTPPGIEPVNLAVAAFVPAFGFVIPHGGITLALSIGLPSLIASLLGNAHASGRIVFSLARAGR